MKNSTLRSAGAITLALVAAFCIGSADAQQTFTPGPAVQPMGPSTVAPGQLPSILSNAPPVSTPSSSAPLASSASSCQTDLSRIASERMSAIEALNKIAKANGGKLDPVAACPKFRALVKIETTFRDYLKQNKDWCGVPDEMADNVNSAAEKDAVISQKACALAAQFSKAQSQAAAGMASQAPKLPAGPL